MCTRKSLLAVVGAAALGVLLSASAHAWQTDMTYVTFNAPVALPGVTLPAGTYEFRSASPINREIVQVLSRNHSKSFYLGITVPIERTGGDSNRLVMLGEAGPGQPAPVKAWFPPNQTSGHMFVYDR